MDGARQQDYAEKEAAAVAAASRQRSLLAVRANRKARLRQQLGRALTSGEYGKQQRLFRVLVGGVQQVCGSRTVKLHQQASYTTT
jgi:hypothetical protein